MFLPRPVTVLPLSLMSLSVVRSCIGSIAPQPCLWQHLPLFFLIFIRFQRGEGCTKMQSSCLGGSFQCTSLAVEKLSVGCVKGMQFSADLPKQVLSRTYHGSCLPKKHLQIPQLQS